MGDDHSVECEVCGVWYGGLDDSTCDCDEGSAGGEVRTEAVPLLAVSPVGNDLGASMSEPSLMHQPWCDGLCGLEQTPCEDQAAAFRRAAANLPDPGTTIMAVPGGYSDDALAAERTAHAATKAECERLRADVDSLNASLAGALTNDPGEVAEAYRSGWLAGADKDASLKAGEYQCALRAAKAECERLRALLGRLLGSASEAWDTIESDYNDRMRDEALFAEAKASATCRRRGGPYGACATPRGHGDD
jgi:hypothetical protein